MSLQVGTLQANINGDESGLLRSLTAGELAMRGFQRDAEGRLRTMDGRFARLGATAEHALGDGQHGVGGNSRRAGLRLGSLSGILARLGSASGGAKGLLSLSAKAAKLPALLGAAIPVAAGVAASVQSILPAAGLAATGILMAVSATAALKLGMSGVGPAIKAAFDPAAKAGALEKALKGLAPQARSFVLALRSMKPQFDALKLSVQGRLFAYLGQDVKVLGRTALPLLRSQLGATASSLNMMAQGVLETATSLAEDGTLGTALKGANKGLFNLAGVPQMVVRGLVQIGAAAAPAFDRVTAAAGGLAAKVSGKLDKAFQSGGIERAINVAINTIDQLGRIAGNVGKIVGSVFHAVQANGASLFDTLEKVTGSLAKAFATPAVQAGLGSLFKTMGLLATTAAPLLGQALGLIAPILTALGPPVQTLITALGTALGPVLAALAPVITVLATNLVPLLTMAVTELAPILTTLAAPVTVLIGALGAGLKPIIKALGPVLLSAAVAVGQLVVALSPILPIIGNLIADLLPVLVPVLDGLSTIFLALTPVVSQVATAIGAALAPVIAGLSKVVSDIVAQYLPVFLSLIQQLVPLIPVLTPVVLQLGESFGQILSALAPLLPQIMLLGVQLVMQLLPAIIPLIPPLAQLTDALLILATGTITGVVIPTLSGLVAFLQTLRRAFQPAIDAVTWLTSTIASVFEWLYDHLVGHSVIPDMVNAIVGWFGRLPGMALSALGSLAGDVAGVAEDAAGRMTDAVRRGIDTAARVLRGFPGMAASALGDLSGLLKRSGQDLIGGFIHGIESMGDKVAGAVGSVLGTASDFFPHSPAKRGPFSGKGWVSHSGKSIGTAFAANIANQRRTVIAATTKLVDAAIIKSPNGARRVVSLLGAERAVNNSFRMGGPAVSRFMLPHIAPAAAGPAVLRVEFAGPQEMKRLIRGIVRDDGGGSVQTAFGRG